jgi:hypothetical protein
MKEGQLKAYINEFEELVEQLGLTQANLTTTQAFMAGLTTPLQDRVNSQPIYRYCVARARAIQEDQMQHVVAEALRARQQQRKRLIDHIQKKHKPVPDEEPSAKLPTALAQHPAAIDHSDQPGKKTTVVPDELLAERQHPVTEAIRMKRQRPMSTEYPGQPEDKSTTTHSNKSSTKKQRTAYDPPIEEQPAKGQKGPNIVPTEES